MIYQGEVWHCDLKDGIAELKIDHKSGSANVFNSLALKELSEAITAIEGSSGIKGLLLTSGKDHFIFGADITEFLGHFKKTDEELASWLTETNKVFNRLEDLPYPSVTAINGFALGGGLEVCLATDFRIASEKAKIGLPETKLGLIPGWGGTVRLSRISGADNAIEWITLGKQFAVKKGFEIGVIDGVVAHESVLAQAKALLDRAISGELNWKERREQKKKPLLLNKMESGLVFNASKGFVAAKAGKNYPAPVWSVMAIEAGAELEREAAIKKETEFFVKCSRSEAAASLIRVFLGDQYLKKKSKKMSKGAEKTKVSAVLGAGIMGGGISYQSASRGIPVIMKDINHEALELGLNEAGKLLAKQQERGRLTAKDMNRVMGSITPTLSYGDFKTVDLVTEAVVENLEIKKSVLADLESKVSDDTLIASNTSTLSINDMASGLKRPERFCGLHFFNPVHKMPLVEVVRGEKTSDETIARAVQYSLQIGKTPLVVNDCAGFLVNRVFFPYLAGFTKLVSDGVDFQRVDKVMEKFGLPMGPAYLLDVIGMDTADHCTEAVGAAYGERMRFKGDNIIRVLYDEKRLGQKSGSGFFDHKPDRKGRIKKSYNPEIEPFIKKVLTRSVDVTDEEIVERMMFPMIFESVRCLDDKIVDSAIEVDMGTLLGLGFPPFRAGALRYAEDFGLDKIVESAKKYEELGSFYVVPESLKEMATNKRSFYEGV